VTAATVWSISVRLALARALALIGTLYDTAVGLLDDKLVVVAASRSAGEGAALVILGAEGRCLDGDTADRKRNR
jgi:hypothetical protein